MSDRPRGVLTEIFSLPEQLIVLSAQSSGSMIADIARREGLRIGTCETDERRPVIISFRVSFGAVLSRICNDNALETPGWQV